MPQSNVNKILHVLRRGVRALLYSKVDEQTLIERYTNLFGRSQDVRASLQRLAREDLMNLVALCPEIVDEDIEEVYQQYRYGARPSFQIYFWESSLNPSDVETEALIAQLNQDTTDFNRELSEKENPSEKELRFIDIERFADITEIEFSFHKRLNYIDPESEAASSIYTLDFGFLWINAPQHYLALHCNPPSIAANVVDIVRLVLDASVSKVRLTKDIVDSVFSPENLQVVNLHSPLDDPERPQSIRYSDKHLISKAEFRNRDQTHTRIGSVYKEQIDQNTVSRLQLNTKLGKLSISRNLSVDQVRDWAPMRISQLFSKLNEILRDNPTQAPRLVDLDETVTLPHITRAGKTVVINILCAILEAKKNGGSLIASPLLLSEALTKLERFFIQSIQPYCEGCGNATAVVCNSCGATALTPDVDSSQLVCLKCRVRQPVGSVSCLGGHRFAINIMESLNLVPKLPLQREIARIINKSVPGYDYNPDSEFFYLSADGLHFVLHPDVVVLLPSQIEQLTILDNTIVPAPEQARITDRLQGRTGLKEKCRHASSNRCQACASERTIECIPKIFTPILGSRPHAHHGGEFGDVAAQVIVDGRQLTFCGLAKSWQHERITTSMKTGKELVVQTAQSLPDQRINILAIIAPCSLEENLRQNLIYLCKLSGKHVVFLLLDELVAAYYVAENQISETS